MLDFKLACHFHHVERADNIAVDIGAWVFETVANAGLGGEVDDNVRAEGFSDLPKRCIVLKQGFCRGEAGMLEQHLVTPPLQIDIIIVAHAVIAMDGKSFGQQQLGEMVADEAGGTSYEDAFHKIQWKIRVSVSESYGPAQCAETHIALSYTMGSAFARQMADKAKNRPGTAGGHLVQLSVCWNFGRVYRHTIFQARGVRLNRGNNLIDSVEFSRVIEFKARQIVSKIGDLFKVTLD